MHAIRILAISGSLRAASSNTAVLRATSALAPLGVIISLYDGLATLPLFNPDLDGTAPPAAVAAFRSRLKAADGILIACPEYAHGVPGPMKNALDWVVSSAEFVNKPVALINAAPRSDWAQASLWETLTMMTASLMADASIALPLPNNKIDAAGILADAGLAGELRVAMTRFAAAIRRGPAAIDHK